jgi:hypothetical protein
MTSKFIWRLPAFLVYLGIAGWILWPGELVAGAMLLGLLLASRGFASDTSPFWRAMAVTLISLPACLFLSGGLAAAAVTWPVDPRSLIVLILAQLALLQSPAALGAHSRAATSVAAAAAAVFLIPLQDTLFLRFRPPILLQLVPIALAPLLALVPLARLSRLQQGAYKVAEPLLLLTFVGLVGLPFLKDSTVAWPWVTSHLLWSLGMPASLAALLNLGPRAAGDPPETVPG